MTVSFTLSPDQQQLVRIARQFAEEQLRPLAEAVRAERDPLRLQFIPLGSRLLPDHPRLDLDSLHERADMPVPGLTHRYTDKALFLPLDVMMSFSMLYELLEWAIAVLIAGDVGQSYLGTQGDEWDAHKDMALASLGALLAMLLTALINGRYQRDFAAEFAESLHVARAEPLGEVRLAELREGESKSDA